MTLETMNDPKYKNDEDLLNDVLSDSDKLSVLAHVMCDPIHSGMQNGNIARCIFVHDELPRGWCACYEYFDKNNEIAEAYYYASDGKVKAYDIDYTNNDFHRFKAAGVIRRYGNTNKKKSLIEDCWKGMCDSLIAQEASALVSLLYMAVSYEQTIQTYQETFSRAVLDTMDTLETLSPAENMCMNSKTFDNIYPQLMKMGFVPCDKAANLPLVGELLGMNVYVCEYIKDHDVFITPNAKIVGFVAQHNLDSPISSGYGGYVSVTLGANISDLVVFEALCETSLILCNSPAIRKIYVRF